MRHIDDKTRRLWRDWRKRRSWCLYQVQLQGRTMSKVAYAGGVSRACIYKAFTLPYPRMEKLIADAVEVPVHELFAERYDADGLPNRRRGRPQQKKHSQDNRHKHQHKPSAVGCNPQNEAAA